MKNNNLNKEERILQDKLNDLNFEFNEEKWKEFETKLYKSQFKTSKNNWLKIASVMLVVTASIYIVLLDYTNNKENTVYPKEVVLEKQEVTPNVVTTEEAVPINESEEENLREEDYEIEDFEEEIFYTSEDSILMENKQEETNKDLMNHYAGEETQKDDEVDEEVVKLEINNLKNICLYTTINFNINNRTLFQEIQWKIDGERFSGEYKFFEPGAYTISVTAKNNGNIYKDTLNLFFKDPQEWDFTYEQMEGIFDDFTVQFITDANVPLSWQIQNQLIEAQQPLHNFNEEGLYDVTATSKDENGCITEVYKPIAVLQDFKLYAAEAFTPNADGVNDEFLPPALENIEYNYSLSVFNLKGKEIFNTNEKGIAWNGKLNNTGASLPKGNYIWKVVVRNDKGKERLFSGTVKIVDFDN